MVDMIFDFVHSYAVMLKFLIISLGIYSKLVLVFVAVP